MEPYRGDVQVRCSAGDRGEEEPRRFSFGTRTVEVARIVDRWLDPHHRYFKVLGDDGNLFMLRHDVAAGAWELYLFPPPTGNR